MDWLSETHLVCAATVLIVLITTFNILEFKKLSAAKTTPFKFLLKPAVFQILGNILLICFPLLSIYYLIAHIKLWRKHGNKFGGILKGTDAVFALNEGCMCHMLSIVEYDEKNNSESFYQLAERTIREKFQTEFVKDPKSFATVQKAFGYYYVLKNDVTFEECFEKMKSVNTPTGTITRTDLTKLLNEYSSTPMPGDNKAFWAITVGTQPVEWTDENKNSSKKYYPVVIRAYHSLVDGLHLFKAILALFGDKDNCIIQPQGSVHGAKKTLYEFLYRTSFKIMHYIKIPYIMLVTPSVFLLNLMLMETDSNLLHGASLINKKIFRFSAEKSPHYVEAAKRVKRKYPGCSFEDVFLAGFTASFNDYFKKHSVHVPEYLTTEMPVVPEVVQFLTLNPQELKNYKLSCQNFLSFCVRKLPTAIASGGTQRSLIEALEFIQKESQALRSCFEVEANAFLVSTIFTIVPPNITQVLINQSPSSDVAISNMIGPVKFTVAGGHPIKDIIVFAGHRRKTGLAACVFTYDNRIKLSLTVDKAIINDEEEVQNILEGVFKYIDLLDSKT